MSLDIKFSRIWAMPSQNTFTIKPILQLIEKTILNCKTVCDPFVRNSPFKYRCVSNDLDPSIKADFNIDAIDFLSKQEDNYFDAVLFDPPYSVRQVSECYKKLGMTVNMQTTQSSFWTRLKTQIKRVTKTNGIVICCGWNSGGIGKTFGFELKEILLVPHGGPHSDTIVTVEVKQ